LGLLATVSNSRTTDGTRRIILKPGLDAIVVKMVLTDERGDGLGSLVPRETNSTLGVLSGTIALCKRTLGNASKLIFAETMHTRRGSIQDGDEAAHETANHDGQGNTEDNKRNKCEHDEVVRDPVERGITRCRRRAEYPDTALDKPDDTEDVRGEVDAAETELHGSVVSHLHEKLCR